MKSHQIASCFELVNHAQIHTSANRHDLRTGQILVAL